MKIALNVKLAVIAGILTILIWYVAARSLGFYSLSIYSYKFFTTLFFLLLGIFLSVFFERRNLGGYISFKAAVRTGLLFSLVFSLIIGLFNFLYHQFIAADAIDFFVSEERKAWLEHNRTVDEVNKYIVEYYIPSFGTFHTIMTTIIWGVILSLLAGAIFRRKNPNPAFGAN
jgi:hypothetical protein